MADFGLFEGEQLLHSLNTGEYESTKQYYEGLGLLTAGREVRRTDIWPYYPTKLRLMYREHCNIARLFPVPGYTKMTFKDWFKAIDNDHKKEA